MTIDTNPILPEDLGNHDAERTAALRSLDLDTILRYCRKWGIGLLMTHHVKGNHFIFWASVHRARLTLRDFTPEEREVSRHWLISHGLSPRGIA